MANHDRGYDLPSRGTGVTGLVPILVGTVDAVGSREAAAADSPDRQVGVIGYDAHVGPKDRHKHSRVPTRRASC